MKLTPEITALLDDADTARSRARDAAAEHATAASTAAAALLRTEWPAAASIVADLSMVLADCGNPNIRTILDANGIVLAEPEFCTELTDRVEELLGAGMDFADETLAGWVQHDDDGGDLYTLTLPHPPAIAEPGQD